MSFLGLWAFLCMAYPPLAPSKQCLQDAFHSGEFYVGLVRPGAVAELEFVRWILTIGVHDVIYRPPVEDRVSANLTTDASEGGWGGLAVCVSQRLSA